MALSCGGLASRLAHQGVRVVAATFCTADYDGPFPLSPAAAHEHRQWQLGDQPYQHRRHEDQQAMALLGVEALHLGLPDAIYRYDPNGRPLYQGKQFLSGQPHSHDWQSFYPRVLDALHRALAVVGEDASLYCPLSIGGHVDHVIVRRAAEQIRSPEHILYYEDYPYAGKDVEALVPYLQQAGAEWQPLIIRLNEQEIQARIAAIACYRSQLEALFGDTPSGASAMPAHLRKYISRAGGERYWQRTIRPS